MELRKMNTKHWENGKRLDDLIHQVRKIDYNEGICNHEFENIANTFIIGGYMAVQQCRKCGMYRYMKAKK